MRRAPFPGKPAQHCDLNTNAAIRQSDFAYPKLPSRLPDVAGQDMVALAADLGWPGASAASQVQPNVIACLHVAVVAVAATCPHEYATETQSQPVVQCSAIQAHKTACIGRKDIDALLLLWLPHKLPAQAATAGAAPWPQGTRQPPAACSTSAGRAAGASEGKNMQRRQAASWSDSHLAGADLAGALGARRPLRKPRPRRAGW